MSDLQCPAVFHVLAPAAGTDVATALLDGAGPAGILVGAPPGGSQDVRVAELARRYGVTADVLEENRSLWDVLEESSDLYRGRHVLVLPYRVAPPLTGEDDAVTVRIDADGRSVERS